MQCREEQDDNSDLPPRSVTIQAKQKKKKIAQLKRL